MPDKQKARACYYAAAAIVVVLLLVILYMWHQHAVKNTGETMYIRKNRVYGDPGNPQHTDMTWGLPVGEGRVDYSGFSKEGFGGRESMSVGAHWGTDGTYGHTASTLPSFGLSGYYLDTPTASWS